MRIFVEDRDEDASVASLLDLQLREMVDEVTAGTAPATYNLDFFNATTTQFPAQCAGSSAPVTFEAFGGVRVGDNSMQESILALDDLAPKSVMSEYKGQVQYQKRAELAVEYTLNVTLRNGIVPRRAMAGVNDSENCFDESEDPRDSRCREKILNMDQTLCAYAYDNSRSRHMKWVGKTNPNGPGVEWALRDHSNGDMASPIHCWRLRFQAPPTFVVRFFWSHLILTSIPWSRLLLRLRI